MAGIVHQLAAHFGKTEAQITGHLAFLAAGLAILVASYWFRAPAKAREALDGKTWQSFKLIERTEKSSNTNLYRFALPSPKDVLGLPVGKHIQVQAECNGKMTARSYTPVSRTTDQGFFELLIKTYPQGNISQHMAKMKIGETLAVKGPKGTMEYTHDYALKIGMLAGGTGITPMLSIIRAVLDNPLDMTEISLIYGNVNESDILVKDELDRLAEEHSRFKVFYVLDKPPSGWKGGEGFVTKDMIKEHLPEPAPKHKILVCGPPPMVKGMVKNLTELGFEEPQTISKPEHQVFTF